MHSDRVKQVVCLLALVLMLAGMGLAQSLAGGRIEGTVTDATGAVVAGASLTAKNVATGVTYTALSNDEGLYAFTVLPVGTYQLTAEKQGFSKLTQSNVVVNVGSKVSLDLAFKVAGQAQEVTVTDEAPVIETTRTQVSDTVNEKAINQLPVNGRNFIDFVLLTPGVTKDVRTGDLSFAGQRGTLNSMTVDGADNNNTFFGQTTGRAGSGRAPYQFSQDSVQEFQVASNSYSAELGRAGGAVINVVTKSGTNAYHGTGFWFYRDQALNAYDPIQKLNTKVAGRPVGDKAKYHFNQFGGNVGGPIVKNRAFFFFDYDGQRNTQPNLTTLPIPKTILDAPTTNQQRAITYLSDRADIFNRGLKQDTYLLKSDVVLNQKNQLSARWNRQLFTGLNFENAATNNSIEHTGDSLVRSDTLTTQLTSTLSNSIVNVFRFTYLRDKEPGMANSELPEAQVRQGGTTLLFVGRNSFSPRETTIKRQQYANTITFLAGRHTFKVGADAIVDKILNYFPGNFSGVYTFNSLEDFGLSLSGLCGGNAQPACPGTYQQAFAGTGTTGPETHPDMLQVAGYVQDDYRVAKNLTVNVGLRYDMQSVKQPSVQNPAALAAGYDTSKIDISKNEWAPRLGFAWTPWADGKAVIRGGYGIFYGNTPSIMVGTAHSNNGINVGTYTLPARPYLSDIYTSPTGGTASAPSIYVFQKDFKNPMVQQANLSTEYALTGDMALTLTYQWVKGTHLQRTRDNNLNPATTTSSIVDTVTGQSFAYQRYSSTRPVAAFQRISVFEGNANSAYNGLSAQLRKRFSHNFQASASYTWGHVIDDAPDATAVVPFSSGDDNKIVTYPTNIALDRASGSNDVRHRFVASYIWDLNYGKNLPAAVRWITSGWQWSGIFAAQTGQPYSAVVNGDLNNDGNRNDRVPGTGRNQFRLPATWTYDPRILRTITIPGREGLSMQLFAEAFNLFNRTNVTGVRNVQYALQSNGTLKLQNQTSAATQYFGMPTGTSGQRIVQLGAKVIF
ncbi:MAG TPA: carboxypeptidase regulatory-like domain-containing protein [Clostridia bacterium]|nr:carboxypeptidase regulatory-like domain-containing protein [Clostridia bacterium]